MTDALDRSDEELAAAAKAGDGAAFDVLVRRYLRPAMALALRSTRDLAAAEDLAQEAFHRAVRALPSYDPSLAFSSWFFSILRNVSRSTYTRSVRRRELVPTESSSDEQAAPSASDPALQADLDRAIGVLAPMQQTCFRLCAMEGLSSIEAGQLLDLTEGTVRTHLHRARQKLRRSLGVWEADR